MTTHKKNTGFSASSGATRILFMAPSPSEDTTEARYVSRLRRRLAESGMCICSLDLPGRLVEIIRFFFVALRRIPRSDVIHIGYAIPGHFLISIAPALALARFFGKPSALHLLAPDSELVLAAWPRLVRAIARLATVTVTPTAYLAKRYAEAGVNAQELTPFAPELKNASRPKRRVQPKILFFDPLTPPSDFTSAITTFTMVKEKYPRAELTLVCNQRSRAKMEQWLASSGIVGVESIDRPTREGVGELMESHDLLLQATSYHTTPLILLAALEVSLPIVCFESGGVNELLSDRGNAHLVEVGNHVALAERVMELIERPAEVESLTLAGLETASQRALVDTLSLWKKLYASAISGAMKNRARKHLQTSLQTSLQTPLKPSLRRTD